MKNCFNFGVQSLKIRHTPRDYGGYFKLQVLNWRKDHNETYQNTAFHFKISSPRLIYNWEKRLAEGRLDELFPKRG
ncbi:helix-turn-helix domain-containing protein [uncultured Lactobacillus sp.]|uniref:helix-turn-helix domain-containing protein n=1 Tax=uncultured Lactobacillus sp. TaxID=153152 RepID=UPI00342ED1DB